MVPAIAACRNDGKNEGKGFEIWSQAKGENPGSWEACMESRVPRIASFQLVECPVYVQLLRVWMRCYLEAPEGLEVCLFFTNMSTKPGTCPSSEDSVLEG